MTLEAKLQSQGGAHPLLLVGAVAASIYIGAAVGAAARALGMPEQPSLIFPPLFGLPTFAFVTWYSASAQGWLRADPRRVTVKARLRGPRVWSGGDAPTLRAWQLRAGGVTRTAGPLLELVGPEDRFTVGAHDPELGGQLPSPSGPTLLVAPDFVLEREDFRRLCETLGVALPSA